MKGPIADHFRNLKDYWQRDIVAGFTVSFVALPLALGIALASGMSVTSGIIATLIGGLIVSHFNGTHIAVNGPPKATIIVTLSSIAAFGGGVPGIQGVLAAFVMVGILMLVFGLFKFGDLGDFFPSSAIQGMLAAVGIMIIFNQLYYLFGIDASSHEVLDLLAQSPEIFTNFNPYVSVIGITSLSFLFIYPYLDSKLFRLIPAPMWVVSYASLMGYIFNFGTERTILFNGLEHYIGPNLMIAIPDKLFSNYIGPDFSFTQSTDFWLIVINITIIASLESLLSARAIDKLDPKRRVSNLNRNLIGTGTGTIFSALLGGLPVISQILPSTVGVNNGSRTKWTNFFNAVTIAIMVIVFSGLLNRIPLAALAAVLVHTGYKLTSIKVIKRTYQFGKEQILIFLITLVITLISDLVYGIFAGIISTFILHSMAGIERKYWLGLLFKSTIHYYHDVEDDHYFISVRRFANFFNYLGLKRELNKVPEKSHLILDFSHAILIDHTVMEHVANFADRYRSSGGVFEIVGLDRHKPSSSHPLSGRRIVEGFEPSAKKYNITRRQRQLKRISYANGWSFTIDTDWQISHLKRFPFFENKLLHFQNNALTGQIQKQDFIISDVSFALGAMEASIDQRMTVMILNLDHEIPEFSIEKEVAIDKVLSLAGHPDIDFDAYPEFSSKFLLKGKNENEIRKFFNRQLIIFFETHSIFHIECTGKKLLIFDKTKLSHPHQLDVMTEFVRQLWVHIQK